MVTIKSEREIELMREAGRILAKVHEQLAKEIRVGMTTKEIDRICEELIRGYGCIPSFLNYEGYPASVCVSINDEVVHGIPSKHRHLKEGDIVSLDTGVIWKGYQSDAARTHMVGQVSDEARKLVEVTEQSFFEGIKAAREGNHLHGALAELGEGGVGGDLAIVLVGGLGELADLLENFLVHDVSFLGVIQKGTDPFWIVFKMIQKGSVPFWITSRARSRARGSQGAR